MQIAGIAINADAGLIDGNLKVLRKELALYQELGFSCVELAPHGLGAIYHGRLNQRRLQELQAILGEYPFRYAVHGPNPMNLMNEEAGDIEWQMFLAGIEFTAAVGAQVMVYHAGRYWPEEKFLARDVPFHTPQEKQLLWERERALLAKLGDVAGRAGVTIAVENARPYLDAANYCYAESLAELGRMVRSVNHEKVGIALDVGHAHLAACRYGYDLVREVGRISALVSHIHLHDNFGHCCYSTERKQYEMDATGRGDMHMPIGWGNIPAAKVLAQLGDYRGMITLELRPRYRDYYHEALANACQLVEAAERLGNWPVKSAG
ncbi:MAG: sugar phosphate isomerase/epimerase [Negativicutes bacterium]|nr:sugar phosphate isomerase/epimerase [Negativicutes bacterium]